MLLLAAFADKLLNSFSFMSIAELPIMLPKILINMLLYEIYVIITYVSFYYDRKKIFLL